MRTAFKKCFVFSVILFFIFTLPTFAAKGDKGGQGYKQQRKDTHEMQHKGKQEGKHASDAEDEIKNGENKKNKEPQKGEMVGTDTDKPDEPTGLAKQSEKKMEQERKELGKGSETGQQKREEHSRKWWKFWE